VVSRQSIDAIAWSRTIDNFKAVNTQPAQGDGVVVVSSFAQKQNINQLITTHVE